VPTIDIHDRQNNNQGVEMPNQKAGFYSQKEVGTAWDKFLCSDGGTENLNIRKLISNSWKRCLTRGVDPEQKIAPLLASQRKLNILLDHNKELMDCARPVIQQAQAFIHELDSVLFFTDYQGVNLEITGDPNTIEVASTIGLVEGSGWSEAVSGSNAVGTAMATRKAIQVHGTEHYCQCFKDWTCTANIITDPYDNQILGVLDLSGLTNIFDKFHVPLVVAWANQIQTALAQTLTEQWSLIEDNSDVSSESNVAKLLFDRYGRLIKSSQNTESILNSLGYNYDPNQKRRLSLEQFGGKKIIYPHDDGQWVSGDWSKPVKHKGEVVGFELHIPLSKTKIASDSSQYKTTNKPKPFKNAFGISPSFKSSYAKAIKAAMTPLPVLLLGDTGAGKEVFAQGIHDSSNYHKGPFVDLNCGSFTKDLLNSELFGHVGGAFTGAIKGGMAGKLESANGGTLFLDEIGEMPLEMQPIFLRVLQEHKIYRVGGIKAIPVDFRLIAATNSNLKNLVAEGRFRKDLYFRLSTITIRLDPLSERREDIQGISQLVLDRLSQQVTPKYLSSALLSRLKNEKWPGNIRELVNVIEYMCWMSQKETLTPEDLPEEYKLDKDTTEIPTNLDERAAPQLSNLDQAELEVIKATIKKFGGNITQAAKTLGMAKGTLYQRMKKYELEKSR
jgi:transcriptional regulator of acetoin/glycerol metabolism